MYDVIAKIIEEIGNKSKITVDLKNKNLIVNDKGWIVLGNVTKSCPDYPLITPPTEFPLSIMDRAESLYQTYKISYPSESEQKRKHNYFKAKSSEEMTDAEMVHGCDRYFTRIILESFILLNVVAGYLEWDDKWGSWYYQGKKDKDFIVLREWIDPLPIKKSNK